MDKPDTLDTLAVEEDQVPANNNNSKEVSGDELELLRKLEEANRYVPRSDKNFSCEAQLNTCTCA